MTAPRAPASKVLSRGALRQRYGRPREGVLVFTNGCFDLLHAGHVTCLAHARSLGDELVVGINSDASAARLGKGAPRPLITEVDRALTVAALESVDAVCVFDEDTPAGLIAELLPDVLVKGGDYGMGDVVGRDLVERAGGRVVLVPLLEGRSTRGLVRKIRGGPA